MERIPCVQVQDAVLSLLIGEREHDARARGDLFSDQPMSSEMEVLKLMKLFLPD